MPELFFKKKWHVLSVTLCTLSAFLLLFIFRDADDNRLTSWKWTFADVELIWFLPLILLGIVFIYILLNLPVTRQRPSLFLVLFSFAVSTIFWKAPEVIVDTSRYFTQSKHLEIYGITYFFSQWGNDIHAWTDLPFVPFLYGLIFTCFGEARAFIQVCTTFAFSMTSLCTYLIGRTLWDEETGFFAGALLLGIPYIFSQVPLMLVDILTMFFLTLSIFTFLKALQNGGVWIPVSAIAVFSAVFSKYSVWIMLSVLGAVFLVYVWKGKEYRIEGADNGRRNLEQGTRTYIYRAAWVALLGGVLIGAVLLLKYDIISEQINFLREYQSPGLRGESVFTLSAFWLMEYFGHEKVSFLNGGLAKWNRENHPTEGGMKAADPGDYKAASPNESIRVDASYVLKSLKNKNAALVDARGTDEYTGENNSEKNKRVGHIPGALDLGYRVTNFNEDGTIKPSAELKAVYEAKGVTSDKEVITYCQGGIKAANAYFTLKHILGYPNVKVYVGSWGEWGNRVDFNTYPINGKIVEEKK